MTTYTCQACNSKCESIHGTRSKLVCFACFIELQLELPKTSATQTKDGGK